MAVILTSIDEQIVSVVTDNLIRLAAFEAFVAEFSATHGPTAASVSNDGSRFVTGIVNVGDYDRGLWRVATRGAHLVPSHATRRGRELELLLIGNAFRPEVVAGMPESIPVGRYDRCVTPLWTTDFIDDVATAVAAWDCPATVDLLVGHRPANRLKQQLDLSLWSPA